MEGDSIKILVGSNPLFALLFLGTLVSVAGILGKHPWGKEWFMVPAVFSPARVWQRGARFRILRSNTCDGTPSSKPVNDRGVSSWCGSVAGQAPRSLSKIVVFSHSRQ